MFILDEPYISEECLDYLEQSRHPVLANAMGRRCASARRLNLVEGMPTDTRRIIAPSEAPLAWVTQHSSNEQLKRAIYLMKDKAEMRRVLAPLQPDYRFEEVALTDLATYKVENLHLPVILKPAIGFLSMGVYTIRSQKDWDEAVIDIDIHRADWCATQSRSVVDDARFIVETYIEGQEYAVDVYYDSEGAAVILDILQHDFASAEDVTDRLYWTDAKLIRRMLPTLTSYFDKVNEQLGLRDFPCHVELREEGGTIIPIEFNPLRFAGLCTTDISWFAYGFKTYECFLDDIRPDWDSILAEHGDRRAAFIVLGPLTDEPPLTDDELMRFDYGKLAAKPGSLCCLRPLPYRQLGVAACLIVNADADDEEAFDWALDTRLHEFVEEGTARD